MPPRHIRPPLPPAPPEVTAARALVGQVEQRLELSGALAQLPSPTRDALVSDLRRIRSALSHRPQALARPFESVASLRNRLGGGGTAGQANEIGASDGQSSSTGTPAPR